MIALSLCVDPLALADLVPPASLAEARAFRDDLSRLLRQERAAAASFLVALADFDRRRGWERLGHASLFSFLTRELGLSKGAAWVRLSATRLLPRFSEVESALREGTLCLSAVGELSRVLTEENRAAVLPRFLGCSSREAREVAAALAPREEVPRREVVTAVVRAAAPAVLARDETSAPLAPSHEPAEPPRVEVRAHEPIPTLPPRRAARRGRAARRRPSSAPRLRLAAAPREDRPGAGRPLARAAGRDHRAGAGAGARSPAGAAGAGEGAGEAAARDGDRCQFPLDAGVPCGSTWQVELDHLLPLALGGETAPTNLRCVCAVHNRLAARRELGPRASERRRTSG